MFDLLLSEKIMHGIQLEVNPQYEMSWIRKVLSKLVKPFDGILDMARYGSEKIF